MTPRTVCMMAAFALGLLVNAALAVWLPAEIRFWKPLNPVRFGPVTFQSVSSSGMHVYAAEFGYGYVNLDLTSFSADGKAEFHSLHMRY